MNSSASINITAATVAQHLAFLPRREAPVGEACAVERDPEAVAGAGKVMAGCAGVEARIDATEEHAKIRANDVRNCFAGGGAKLIPARLERPLCHGGIERGNRCVTRTLKSWFSVAPVLVALPMGTSFAHTLERSRSVSHL